MDLVKDWDRDGYQITYNLEIILILSNQKNRNCSLTITVLPGIMARFARRNGVVLHSKQLMN